MKSLKKKISELLDLANQLFKEQGESFDFSISSLQSINKILNKAITVNKDQAHLNPKLLALGVYLGETVIKNVNECRWDRQVNNVEEASINFMSGSKIWPIRQVFNCWKNGFVAGDISSYTNNIVEAEKKKIASREKKKVKKVWWQFWKQ